MEEGPDEPLWRLAPLLRRQSGVIRRAQLRESGLTPADIRRLLRRRELVVVHPGVYVDHTGPMSWDQRSWAAVLACWPAALRGESARRSADLRRRDDRGDQSPIDVVVDWGRSLRSPEGVRVRRSRRFDAEVDWTGLPPRQPATTWVLDLAAESSRRLDAVAVIADAVGARQAVPEQLRAALRHRARIAERPFLTSVIDDVASGTCSVLEHGFLDQVERPHGLPTAGRQVRDSVKGTLYRDVEYADFGLIVELDGRLHHSGIQHRDRDLERDLASVTTGRLTVRLGWGQVFERACTTASQLGAILTTRGWQGRVRPCPACRPRRADDRG